MNEKIIRKKRHAGHNIFMWRTLWNIFGSDTAKQGCHFLLFWLGWINTRVIRIVVEVGGGWCWNWDWRGCVDEWDCVVAAVSSCVVLVNFCSLGPDFYLNFTVPCFWLRWRWPERKKRTIAMGRWRRWVRLGGRKAEERADELRLPWPWAVTEVFAALRTVDGP